MLDFASAIFGALIGAIAGVLLTGLRVRKERGFDRQLQWCESMMAALNRAGAAVTSASQGTDRRAQEECWTETIGLYEQLIPLCGQKELYAPSPAIELINTFMRELQLLIDAHLAGHAGGQPLDCDRCLNAMRTAVGSLASIGRKHLGLKGLPKSDTLSPTRFMGSFRGRSLGTHRSALP